MKESQFIPGNYPFTRRPFSCFVQAMARLGVSHIELYAASPHLYVYDYSPDTVKPMKRALQDAGIGVACMTPEQCLYPVSISIGDDLVRARSMDYYMRSLELAAAFESPLLQMISGGDFMDEDPARSWDRAAEGLNTLASQAQRLDVTIVLEADRTCTVRNTAQQRRMIDEVGSPALCGMIDTNAVYHAGEDFEECVSLLGGQLRHLHFMDLLPETGCLIPGTGILPLASYLRVLDRYGYTGYLTPELWGTRYTDRAQEATRQSLDFCYSCLTSLEKEG